MFTKKSPICLHGARWQHSLKNSQFNQKIHEEDRRDKILEDTFMRSTEENPYHKQIQSSIQLCNELKEEKQRSFLLERRDLVRRLNNDDLKQLERQLRAAYVSKAIAAQKFEREVLKLEEIEKVNFENNVLAESRLRQDEFAKKADEQVRQRKAALKQDLLEQMAETNAKREEEKMNIRKEKQMIDDAVNKYREENLREEREALEKKIKIRNGMEEFKKSQEKWKLEKTAATQQEDDKEKELIKQRILEQQKAKQDKRNLQERKNKLSEQIGKRTQAITEEKIKTMDFLIDLLIDERKAKEEIKSQKDEERQMRERIIIRQDLSHICELKQRQKLEQKKQDDECYREEMRLLAERDKLQKLADEKKKIKVLEHRQALQNALDEKNRLKATEMKRLLLTNEAEVENNNRRNKLVEKERIRMLKEHAPGLRGFLPIRFLHQSDREFLSL